MLSRNWKLFSNTLNVYYDYRKKLSLVYATGGVVTRLYEQDWRSTDKRERMAWHSHAHAPTRYYNIITLFIMWARSVSYLDN